MLERDASGCATLPIPAPWGGCGGVGGALTAQAVGSANRVTSPRQWSRIASLYHALGAQQGCSTRRWAGSRAGARGVPAQFSPRLRASCAAARTARELHSPRGAKNP